MGKHIGNRLLLFGVALAAILGSGRAHATTYGKLTGTGSGGGSLSPIADQTLLGNVSGVSATPTALTATQVQTVLSVQPSNAVVITGGTASGLAITASSINLGGNTLYGNTSSSGVLTLSSTSNGTKGTVVIGSTTGLVYYETTPQLSIGIATPDSASVMHLKRNTSGSTLLYVENPSTGSTAQEGVALGSTDDRSGAMAYWLMTGPSFTTVGDLSAGTMVFQLLTGSGNIVFRNHQSAGTIDFAVSTSDTVAMSVQNSGVIRIGTPGFTANGSVATAMSSLGPAGSHTTVQEWLTVQDNGGTVRYIPGF